MDEGLQAVENPDPSRHSNIHQGSQKPRPRKKGRPKELRPVEPELARELVITLQHFFPDLASWLGAIPDARNPAYTTFPLTVLLLHGVVMFLTHCGSRNHFNNHAVDAPALTQTIARLSGCAVDAIPHLDTLEKALRKLPPAALDELPVRLIQRLIRMKALDDWRVGGAFMVAIDGTGLFSFRQRHCEHCMETHHSSGVITYSHKALVAFIVSSDGFAMPIAYEFIENAGPIYDKQDCELKAFHRLAPVLKRLLPQTPLCLLLDALYAAQTVIRACEANGWNYSITFKPGDMPALWREAQALLALSPEQRSAVTLPGKEGTREIRWVNDLEHEGLTVSAIFQEDRHPDGEIVHFAHLVGKPIDVRNSAPTATASRQRWRCENEGFNVLKNGGFALEHVYSHHSVAARCYFVLMLMAHQIQQLLTKGRLHAVFKKTFGTFLAYGEKLLVALKSHPLPPEWIMPGQIRLNTA